MKQNQSYTAEFRTEAVRMVLEQGLSQAEVAARRGAEGITGQLGGQRGQASRSRVWPRPAARSFRPRWCGVRRELAQDFRADAPGKVWLMDITYVCTDEGWLYLAGVNDVFAQETSGKAFIERTSH